MALKASISYQEQPRQARHGKYIEDGVEAQAFYRTTGILEVRDKRAARSGNCSRGSGGCGSPRNTDNNPRYIFGRRIVPGFTVQARQAGGCPVRAFTTAHLGAVNNIDVSTEFFVFTHVAQM